MVTQTLLVLDRKNNAVIHNKVSDHTVEYLIYFGPTLIGVFKITQRQDGAVEYTGNGAGNDDPKLNTAWFNLYYNMLIPVIRQEEGEKESAIIDQHTITLRGLAGLIKSGNPIAVEIWKNEIAPLRDDFRKAMKDYIERSFENHPAKPLFEMLKNASVSQNPIQRAFARQYDSMSIEDMRQQGAKWIAEEMAKSANDLPVPDTIQATQELPPVNTEGLEKVKELSRLGLPVKVIAQRASLSESTVKRYRKTLGLQRRKR